jgi:hypothetical protein
MLVRFLGIDASVAVKERGGWVLRKESKSLQIQIWQASKVEKVLTNQN